MSSLKTHFDAALGGVMPVGICGHVASGPERLTSEAHKVTCRLCRRRIGRAALESAETLAALEASFVPSEPYPITRQRWDERGPSIVKRSIEGDDVVREYVWSSLDAALSDWRLVGISSLVASSSSYGSGGGRTDHEPAAMARVARVVPVGRAIGAACASGRLFDGGEDGRGRLELSAVDVRFVVDLCVSGCGDADVSGRLASRLKLAASSVTAHQVSVVWREARRTMHAYLSTRKLIPRTESRGSVRPATEETMAHLPGYELEGIKEIASYLGVSEATVNRFITRDASSNPLRVVKYCNRWHASKAEIDAWRARELKRPAA